MTRSEFDNLELSQQVEYINKKLLEGETITNISKNIGIGRTTIRDRFKTIGYEYNKDKKQYNSIIEVVAVNNVINKTYITKEEIQKSSKKVVGTDLVNNSILEQFILNYETMNDKLEEVYNWYLKSSDKVVIEEKKLNIEDFEGDLVTRSFKLYEPIQKEFACFCKLNSKYKVQDILCQFIKEGLEKYS